MTMFKKIVLECQEPFILQGVARACHVYEEAPPMIDLLATVL